MAPPVLSRSPLFSPARGPSPPPRGLSLSLDGFGRRWARRGGEGGPSQERVPAERGSERRAGIGRTKILCVAVREGQGRGGLGRDRGEIMCPQSRRLGGCKHGFFIQDLQVSPLSLSLSLSLSLNHCMFSESFYITSWWKLRWGTMCSFIVYPLGNEACIVFVVDLECVILLITR
jgi:hypothetical protein